MTPEDFAKKLENLSLSTEVWQEIGDAAAEQIQKRTLVGYSVRENGGQQSKLKPLSEQYKRFRGAEPLPSSTTPGKSNLTLTGEMLSSIVVRTVPNGVILSLSGFPAQKCAWQEDQGRPFFHLSKAEIAKLAMVVKREIKLELSRG
jgi:hypothetical protein